ncbi:MAG TPA: WD40 repeat domain-containing protein, partial [Saprospiraceae bacterium]|nr:WD40 repeat domain-containing protein [Saprospiraceae bacterium]
RVWNPETGSLEIEFKGHETPIHKLCFSEDAKVLASASGGEGPEHDNSIRIWDLDRLEEKYCLRGHSSPVYSIAFSPDGQFLASGSGFGVFSEISELFLWDLVFEMKIPIAYLDSEKRIDEIGFSTANSIVMTKHDRYYGELGQGVHAPTGNRYVTRFWDLWDLNEIGIYRKFDAEVDISRGIARMGDGEWLGVANANFFYAHHLDTFCSLLADERIGLLRQHPFKATWVGADGNKLVFYSFCRG